MIIFKKEAFYSFLSEEGIPQQALLFLHQLLKNHTLKFSILTCNVPQNLTWTVISTYVIYSVILIVQTAMQSLDYLHLTGRDISAAWQLQLCFVEDRIVNKASMKSCTFTDSTHFVVVICHLILLCSWNNWRLTPFSAWMWMDCVCPLTHTSVVCPCMTPPDVNLQIDVYISVASRTRMEYTLMIFKILLKNL